MATKLLGTRNINLLIFVLLTISAMALNSRAYFPHDEDFLFKGFLFEVTVNSLGMTFIFWPVLAVLVYRRVQMPVARVVMLAAAILAAIGLTG